METYQYAYLEVPQEMPMEWESGDPEMGQEKPIVVSNEESRVIEMS